ncbi:MAG TPA: GNAT family N-acetyltransferase [Burkholderiales bacterium]|nr:GNAT family N-acetyltransferase [Burkholderiales bacterium]
MARADYPSHLVDAITLGDGTRVTIRPIRAEDAEIEQDFVRGLSVESRYFRFMDALNELSPRMLKRFTDIDYANELALIAVIEQDGAEVEIGVARYVIAADGGSGEFAIVVADDWQRRGIATALMLRLIASARTHGLATMYGFVLHANHGMLALMRRLGFRIEAAPGDPTLVRVVLDLAPPPQPAAAG